MNQSILKENKLTETNVALLNLFFEKGDQTVAELAAGLNVSIPYATKSLNELVSAKMVHETGKRDNHSRRAPRVYDLIPEAGYFLGIDTGHDRLNLALTDFCGNIVSSNYKIPYDYVNDLECFETLIAVIDQFIEQSGIERSNIIKACMTVGGRVNPYEGKAHNYFTCLDKTLAEALTDALHIDTCIDNDTRCMTFGEWYKGSCKGQRNVVFVNVSWGLGIGIIIDGKMCLGKSGYSGEMGHVHIYNNGIICHCGKTGCMSLQDILDAIKREDVLSIESLQQMATELGNNLAGIINIFNPEMLVIGGDLSVTGDNLTQPIRMGIHRFSLNMVSEDSIVTTSTLTDKAGVIGACLLARHRAIEKKENVFVKPDEQSQACLSSAMARKGA